MFALKDIITAFNKKYHKKIKGNQTWGLLYLKPENLAFLNASLTLVEDAAHYNPPIKIDYAPIRRTVAKAKAESTSNALKLLRQALQQLKHDAFFLQRLDWEQKNKTILNQPETWQRWKQTLPQNNPQQHLKLQALKSMWEKHQAFTPHSHHALLYLLAMVVEYQAHFDYAIKELNKKQNAWLILRRIPKDIAEPYQKFLQQQKERLNNLRYHIIEALLLRLRVAEAQGNITKVDVSCHIIQQLQQLPITYTEHTLPKSQDYISAFLFNQLHVAVEKHGTAQQREQLYNQRWYKAGKDFAATGIKAIKVKHYRLLAPEALEIFVPKKPKSSKLFSDKACLQFFEDHQQLFASFTSPLTRSCNAVEALSVDHPLIQQLTTHYQLIKAASLEKPEKIPWWQFKRKKLQQQWQRFLPHYFYQAKIHCLDHLKELQRILSKKPDLLQNQTYCNRLWLVVHRLNELIRPDLSPTLLQQLEQHVDKLAKLLKQDAISQWITILKDSEVNPENFTHQKKCFVIEVAEQMRLRDIGLPPHQQLSPMYFHLYASEKIKQLLMQLKSNFKQNLNIKKFILDMSVINALGDDEAKLVLRKYLEKWLIRYADNLTDTNKNKALQFAKLACLIVRHYGSSTLQAKFNKLPACDNPMDWQIFIKGFNQITQELAAKYTQHYAEKSCRRLDKICDRELIKLTNPNVKDYAIVQGIVKKLITSDKLQLDELEQNEVMIKTLISKDKNSIQSLIELKASLPFFVKKIAAEISNEDKNKWLDLLTATTLLKNSEYVSLASKRY